MKRHNIYVDKTIYYAFLINLIKLLNENKNYCNPAFTSAYCWSDCIVNLTIVEQCLVSVAHVKCVETVLSLFAFNERNLLAKKVAASA